MGIIERLEDEYLEVSSTRASLRDLLELVVGSALFVLVGAGLTDYLLGRSEALVVAGVLVVIFTITLVSQAYWAVSGRGDYDE